ncbi:MAG: zf-HC2 domain-containing protein [Acidobacteria bacterium]|nr:zf-HC2 domain-containing protein [Acidobacteriota bacterium]
MSLMPTCQSVQERATDYLEGQLGLRARLGIRLHLLLCRACHAFVDGLRHLPGFAKRALGLPSETPPGSHAALEAALRRIRAGD